MPLVALQAQMVLVAMEDKPLRSTPVRMYIWLVVVAAAVPAVHRIGRALDTTM